MYRLIQIHMSKADAKNELLAIPGIGVSLSKDLELLCIKRVDDLKGKDPQVLYDTLIKKTGTYQDRCVLYTFRCAVYFATHRTHDPELLKWWNWSDVNLLKR